MGTGITSILLYNFPYPAHWLRIVGTIIFILNIVVFCLLATANVVRYMSYRGIFKATVTHPLAGMFWGTLPMGLATIVVSYPSAPQSSGTSG
jgi:tellurite resistance protein TehA-like permease